MRKALCALVVAAGAAVLTASPTAAAPARTPDSPVFAGAGALDAATKMRIQQQCPPGNVCFWESRYFGGRFHAYPNPSWGGICGATEFPAGSVYNRDDQTWRFYKAPSTDCSNEALMFSLAPEQWNNGVDLWDPVVYWD